MSKKRLAKSACIIASALILGPLSSLIAQTKPQSSGQGIKAIRVPFVGCNSDGQQGLLAAPKGISKLVQIDSSTAKRLAYYRAGYSSGVLAPRGWYCFETYGSGGLDLYVAPQPMNSDDLFSEKWNGFTGPAIEVSFTLSSTSGRFKVAQVIARVFPARKAFVQSVIKLDIEPASDFPFGPFPKDKLIYKNDRIVEYQTPAHSEGLGTLTWLRANNLPINGVEILLREESDLLSVAVRLPAEMNDLTPQIIQQFERENEQNLSQK
jgi:hypothetical protein